MWNARLDKHKLESRLPGKNINNLRYTDDTTLMAEREELKNLLKESEEECKKKKVSLKLNIPKTNIMASGPITSWQIYGETVETVRDYFFWAQNHCRWWLQPWNEKTLTPWKKSCDQPRQHMKKQRHYFANKGPSSQGYGFSSSHVWMQELDYKKSCVPKNWCFWTVVLEKTLESPLDCKEIQPVHPKGDQSWVFIGRADAEAETPIFWPPDAKNWLIGKNLILGKIEAEGEGDNRGWDGWMAPPTRWAWVW